MTDSISPNLTAENITLVCAAWASTDDWGVPSLYVSTLQDIIAALRAGDDAEALAKHGKHSAQDCMRKRCDLTIPYCIAQDQYMAQYIQTNLPEFERKARAKALLSTI